MTARPLAIILARAGSKGVPGKNIALVGGRPCIAWTLEACGAAACRPRVVVSTDDARAAAVAKGLGAEVVDRPSGLATDSATVDDAARHAARMLDHPREAPIFVLYANVPVRPLNLLDRAHEMLCTSGCDSVQSFAPVGKRHPWWTVRVDEATGALAPWEGETLFHGVYRRQSLPAAFVPDGGVTVLTRASLMLEVAGVAPGPHAFLGRDRRGVVTSEGAVVDIDSPLDLAVADAVLSGRRALGSAV